jgi:CBS domain containing-hemolysin-like protein
VVFCGDISAVQILSLTGLAVAPWAYDVLMLLSIVALVLLNGFFVAAEFSLVAVRKTRVEELVHQGVKSARAVESAIHHMDHTIAATQLGVTLASIGLGWLGEVVLVNFLLDTGWSLLAIHSVAFITAFVLVTFMHVVFGELVPKMLALQSPDKTALWLARPLRVFTQLTRPLTLIMKGTANAVVRLFGYQVTPGEEMVHSVEELALLIEDTEEAGILAPDQAEFVQNVFRLSDKRVRDCLVPRDKMATLELTTPPDKVLEAVRQGAHTRMPVYEGQLDHIVGIVNTKDLFYLFSLRGVVILEDAMYLPLFLKPDSTMADALRLFRKAHRPMALVRDDDGKILGLITLEDVLEEIIGDIEDEHDRPTPKVTYRRSRPLPKPVGGKPGK